jgi:hypothetical protein
MRASANKKVVMHVFQREEQHVNTEQRGEKTLVGSTGTKWQLYRQPIQSSDLLLKHGRKPL